MDDAVAARARVVACPVCEVDAGARCLSASGRDMATVHIDRFDLILPPVPDFERCPHIAVGPDPLLKQDRIWACGQRAGHAGPAQREGARRLARPAGRRVSLHELVRPRPDRRLPVV